MFIHVKSKIILAVDLIERIEAILECQNGKKSHLICFYKKRIAHKHRNANKIKPNASKYQLNILF